jgi:hypothetical protein
VAIVEEMKGLTHYPVMATTPEANTILDDAIIRLSKTSGNDKRSYPLKLKLFDCYCDLTGTSLTVDLLKSSEIQTVLDNFCGAVMNGDFVLKKAHADRQNICREVAMILREAQAVNSGIWLIEWRPGSLMSHCVKWEQAREKLDGTKILFWCGWAIQNRSGKTNYLPIGKLWLSHGKEFATQWFETLKMHISGEGMANIAIFNKMSNFLTTNSVQWPANTFTDRLKIYQFFGELAKLYFVDVKPNAKNLPPLKKSWNRFISRIEQYFILPGIWVTPIRSLPKAPSPNMRGHQSHVRETSDGQLVKEKLITDIPLHISNSDAIQLLFFQISADLKVVQDWSNEQFSKLSINNAKRKKKAAVGTPIVPGERTPASSITLENICATFEKYTYDIDLHTLLKRLNEQKKSDISLRDFAYSLGIPSTLSLFPLQCALIIEHPQITRSFLLNFTLYDKHENLTGIFLEDGAYHLDLEDKVVYISGLKPRRGKENARQTFPISEKAAEIINLIIDLTTPARNYLRSKGDENWKYLFLGSKTGACSPTRCSIPSWSEGGGPILIKEVMDQFSPHTTLRDSQLKDFIFRISIGSIRASRVIEKYIETADSKLASELLGHKTEQTKLLDSYLPAPIVAYIETRGVRTLQKIIICHALADSAFLLLSTNFENLEILDAFLKTHVDPKIPAFLIDPDGLEEKDVSDLEQELIIRIGIGTLSTLLSISQAVKISPTPAAINPTALYWAKVANLIAKEIELLHDPLLKKHLTDAQAAADPLRMENLIHGTSH